ncbi:unnamed protein product, partial [Mesorhabditis belari]|uniref:Uncharacterized protein n=1 Tax=Mesorhabditis belari TaxID=2138241 RepID=A0AAF3EWE5_9BILA
MDRNPFENNPSLPVFLGDDRINERANPNPAPVPIFIPLTERFPKNDDLLRVFRDGDHQSQNGRYWNERR